MAILLFTEGKRLGDWLFLELTGRFNREQETLLSTGADQTLYTGTVLGKVTASGKCVPINFAGADGSQNAYAILGPDVIVPAGVDTQTWAIARGPALVRDLGLGWPVGATAGQIAAAVGQLKSAGIITRSGA